MMQQATNRVELYWRLLIGHVGGVVLSEVSHDVLVGPGRNGFFRHTIRRNILSFTMASRTMYGTAEQNATFNLFLLLNIMVLVKYAL